METQGVLLLETKLVVLSIVCQADERWLDGVRVYWLIGVFYVQVVTNAQTCWLLPV